MLCMIVKAMADLQEVKRQEPFLENLAKVITMEIAECEIGLREHSPAEAELLLLKMRDITPQLAEYRQKLSRTQSICPKFKDPVASALQQQFKIWAHKMKLDEEQVQQLRTKVVFTLDFQLMLLHIEFLITFFMIGCSWSAQCVWTNTTNTC